MFDFYKYQSLGNDFILFDYLEWHDSGTKLPWQRSNWQTFVSTCCHRHQGIGGDGILVIKPSYEKQVVECLIFNKDGSLGKTCLNGLRCVARHLLDYHHYPQRLTLTMSDQSYLIAVDGKAITMHINTVDYQGRLVLNVGDHLLSGHVLQLANPHWVLIKKMDQTWLQHYGQIIECHHQFIDKTNVELVDFQGVVDHCRAFRVLVHERGCGMTQACGSGAAAIMVALLRCRQIAINEVVILLMLGGPLHSSIDSQGRIVQIAKAEALYRGQLSGRQFKEFSV